MGRLMCTLNASGVQSMVPEPSSSNGIVFVSSSVPKPERRTAGGASLLFSSHRMRSIGRSEEHTSELQSLMRSSYAVFCLKNKRQHDTQSQHTNHSKAHYWSPQQPA